ncbi:MAG: hypothetical protein FWB99_02810 [Treponema sp.]|nr:hypothetical protein [Treponema sp.]
MKRNFFILFLTFSVFFVFALEENEDTGTVYVIREIDFSVDGITRPFALMIHGEFKEGRRITGSENLQEYLALKRQLLLNQRVLEDVHIEYFLGEAEEDGELPVKLLVSVRDSRNFIILPVPRYTTSDGFNLTLKARHYNFLGTMSPFRVDLGYSQQGDDRNFNFSIESDTPFQAAGLNWNLTFNHLFDLTVGQPLFYQNVTGLSVQLPWRTTTLTVGFNQYLTINEEPCEASRVIYGVHGPHRPYGTTELFASYRIPLGITVGGFGEIAYTPALAGRINYPLGNMDEVRKPRLTFSHSIGFGRINWIGNYRQGLAASISNSFCWYFDRSDAPFRAALDGSVTVHWPLTAFLGVSSRLRYRQWWQWSDEMPGWIPHFNGGDVLRGVLDSNMWRTETSDIWADRMLSLNFDVPIRVLNFQPSEWFNNRRLRLFDFEMHFSPFIDLALLRGPYNRLKDDPNEGSRFSFNDMVSTGGFEIIVFSGFFRNLILRASVGYNLQNNRGFFGWDEIFIGTSFHY